MGKTTTQLDITQQKIFYSAFLIVAFCVAAFGVYIYYYFEKKSGLRRFEQQLAQKLAERKKEIHELLTGYTNQAKIILGSGEAQKMFEQLVASPKDSDLAKKIAEYLDENSTNDSNHNSIFINASGQVLFSDFASSYIGINLEEEPHRSSALGQSFMRAVMTLTNDIAQYSYDPILKRPALFITLPFFNEKKILVGTFVTEVRTGKINSIMNDYIGLGKTGDILFGELSEEGILLVSQSRNEGTTPFKRFITYKRIIASTIDFPLAEGSEGDTNTGIMEDYLGVNSIAAWTYVPRVDWGATARQNFDEFMHQYKNIRIFAYLLLLLIVLTICWLIKTTYQIRQQIIGYVPWFLRIVCIAIALLVVIKGYLLVHAMHAGLTRTKERVQLRTNLVRDEMTRIIASVEAIGTTLASNLSTNYLKKEDIVSRLQRDLKQYPMIREITVAFEPYQFSKDKRMYAPSVLRKGDNIETIQTESIYDYLDEENRIKDVLNSKNWAWYSGAKKAKRIIWFDPYFENNDLLIGYSVPFYQNDEQGKKKIGGVICVIINSNIVTKLAQEVDIGKSGYTMLLSADGIFMYHPRKEYVAELATLSDLAQEQGNTKLLKIAEGNLKGEQGLNSYTDANGAKVWIYSANIPATKWVLNSVFSAQEGALPNLTIRKYGMQIIAFILLFLLVICGMLHWNRELSKKRLSWLLTGIFLASIVMMLALVWVTPAFNIEEDKVLSNQSFLDRLLHEHDVNAQKINEPVPIRVPTGIDITSMNFPTSTSVSLSGYIWQRYGKELDPSLIKELHFESIELAKFRKLYEVKQGDETVVGWEFNAIVDQKFDYSQYPFDSVDLNLSLEYPDMSKPILLIPALTDYKHLKPQNLPGFEPISKLSGYLMYESFFTFGYYEHYQTWGLDSFESIPRSLYLSYRLMMKRNLLYDFIVFVLPILIIFFLLYAIFIIEDEEQVHGLFTLSAYTGLAFALTLLHRTVRGRIETGDILYIEYLFFMIYITFSVLVVYTILRVLRGKAVLRIKNIFSLFRLFFWPVELLMLFIITLLVFY